MDHQDRPVAGGPLDEHALTDEARDLLVRTARSRQTSQAVANRARLVLDCADVGIAEAARRAAVSHATAAKWWRRHAELGVPGLVDAPRSGRPRAAGDVARKVLECALDDPPNDAERWTTRAVADASGISQAAASRIRRDSFPPPAADDGLPDLPTSALSYVDVHRGGCVLGFHTAGGPGRLRPPPPDHLAVVETIVCAALLRPVSDEPEAGRLKAGVSPALVLLRRVAERLSGRPPVTLLLNVELDPPAQRWLAVHEGFTAVSVAGERWLHLVHRVATSVDPRQLPELRELQGLIRRVRRTGETEFVWFRTAEAPYANALDISLRASATGPPAGDLTTVVRGICSLIAAGELQAGEIIAVRSVARRSRLSVGRIADALGQLAEEALIDRQAGQYLLPVPTPRDVIETYTARGLLGTAIARRLAAERIVLPSIVDEQFAGLVVCDEQGLVPEAQTLDLDFQDELARAAAMPRIGSMFVRLSLQIRLFLTIFGLSYRYPTAEIRADDLRILEGIRSHDPDRAVDAWRHKIDNAARYMLNYLRPLETPGDSRS